MNKADGTAAGDHAWKRLYLTGGVAALAAGLVFRRNLGPEAYLLTGQALPDSAMGWFTLLQDNRLPGLVMLNLFDVVDYALVGLMFLALCVVLWRYNRSYTLIAAALGLAGITICITSNSAVSMLSLSDQYAAATTDAQRSMLLAAGEAILAIDNPGAYFQGTGAYMGFLLVATAGLALSLVMLQSGVFGRVTAFTGILASVSDLAFCVLVAFVPWTGLILVPLAGLLLMIWHILTGLKLIRLWRDAPEARRIAMSNADTGAI
ncbi:MAG: hypothetical protein A4E28_00487 [Methanocella sp. PtaU1.Bin125]|nr:MAG: hypothetical protein A4E28_00487 [Methanocella sp. PtaU1.Bin125]